MQQHWGTRLPLCMAKKLSQRLEHGDSCVPRLQLHPITARDNGAIPKCLCSPCQAQMLSSKGLLCIGRALFSYRAFKATLSLAVCVLQAVALQGGRYLVQGQLRHGRFGTSLPVATGGMCPPPPPQNAGGAALPAPTPAGSPSPTPRAWELGAGGSGSSNTQPPSPCMGRDPKTLLGWKVLHRKEQMQQDEPCSKGGLKSAACGGGVGVTEVLPNPSGSP